MKYILILALLICSSLVSAKILAEVGAYQITSADLQKEIDNFKNNEDFTYDKIKQIAFSNLLDKNLIRNYALEKRIYIDDAELEAFFVQQVGDLPRFQSDGTFDRNKFQDFKNTNEGRKILKAMKEELLITKTRTILEKSFDLSEEELLKQYFLQNTTIDLGYAIIDKQDIDFNSEISHDDFEWYYNRNKHKFRKEEKVKLNLFVVLNEEFQEAVKSIVSRKITAMILADSTFQMENVDEFRDEFTKEETNILARQKAHQITELLQAGANISQPIIESTYLGIDDKLGNLPDVILKSSFELDKGQFSEPINIGIGYLVFSVIDKKKVPIKNRLRITNNIWCNYITKKKNNQNDGSYRQYFEQNFEQFIIPAAIITKVEISNPSLFSSTSKEEYQLEIKYLLERNSENEDQINRIVKDYNLSESKESVYLEKFENLNIIDDMIAIRINRGEFWGFIPTDKKIVFYKVLSFFPEFIPSYRRIQDQLPKFKAYTKADSTDFNDYFQSHQKDFRTPDSLQIGGVIFSVANEMKNLEQVIPVSNLKQVYNERLNQFYSERSVKFEYIFMQNVELAKIVAEQANNGTDCSLLEILFGNDNKLAKDKITSYEELPQQVSLALSEIGVGLWTRPVSYDNGWIILKKIKEYSAGILPFSEMENELREEVLFSIADSVAYDKAKTVFDSTRYFSHLAKYVEKKDIFKTEFQDAKEDFIFLRDISKFRAELLRMWNNEKYSGIIKLENAYAVIYPLKIRRSIQLTYEEALPKITDIHNSSNEFEFAKLNTSVIKEKIAAGANPDSLLYYLGGWNVISELSLTSKIPHVDFSEAIFDDILKHQEGYCSSIIPVNSDKLFFYKLLKLERPTKDDFYQNKELYEKRYLKTKFEKWKNKYRVKVGVSLN